jgi:CheY-like chemotaxis protein
MMEIIKPITKIAVADDEEDILDIIKYALEDTLPGIAIKTFSSGQQLIQESLIFHPDLFLLDFMMPEMNGQAILKAIRLFPSIAQTPIIFITARIQKEEIDEYLAIGAIDVIQKPFNPLMLAQEIQKAWTRYQQNESKKIK